VILRYRDRIILVVLLPRMKTKQLWLLSFSAIVSAVVADVYMHNPPGSNDRNCGGTGENRDNGDRLFDSQNNDKGGYSCPRAFPFPCYKYEGTDKACCNAQNTVNRSKTMVDRFGNIVEEEITLAENCTTVFPATEQKTQYFYEGSVLRIQWTNQHGFGQNSDLHSNVILQYACDEDLTDSCGEIPVGQENAFPFGVMEGAEKTCYMRDGAPINNVNNDNSDQGRRDGRATETIPFDEEDYNGTNQYQDDYRYGRHETVEYYRQCLYRERNKGLFIADQNVVDRYGSTATRQNPNGNRGDNNRDGYECPEESEYYPYWHWTPWRDIANIVDDDTYCWRTRFHSGNVRAKGRCTGCATCRTIVENENNNEIGQPNNEVACNALGGTWVYDPSHKLERPECIIGDYSRVNHLGSIQGGEMPHYDWTIPPPPNGADSTRCVLRMRYNISTRDFNSKTWVDSNAPGDFLGDDSNDGEIASYRYLEDYDRNDEDGVLDGNRVAINVNSNQHGRVFQDRSYVFEIRKKPSEVGAKKITNVNVRGKRGNIVEVYPSVQYDFAPSKLTCNRGDYLHIQWTGSDYNPSRSGDEGKGGPEDPQSSDRLRSDRSNLVERKCQSCNTPILSADDSSFFDDTNLALLAGLGQTECLSLSGLQNLTSDYNKRQRHHMNCAKINTAHPYFDGGLHKCDQSIGDYFFMSTRNNHFGYRTQKLTVTVRFNTVLIIVAVFAGVALVMGAAAFIVMRRRRKNKNYGDKTIGKLTSAANAIGSALSNSVVAPTPKVTAQHNYDAQEGNELSFRKGDKIEVIRRDPSGWWEGKVNGREGLFPSSYVM